MKANPLALVLFTLVTLCLFIASPSLWPAAAVGETLPAPANIRCQGRAGDEVRVSWQDNADDEDEYRVERRIGSGNWSEVQIIEPDEDGKYDSYIESGVDPDQPNRQYRVRSYRSSDDTFSPYSAVCNNRRAVTTDNFRIFYGLRGTDQCPQIDGRDVCLTDTTDGDGQNIFVNLQATALEGSLDAFTRLGFANSAGTPPSGLDRIPINVTWCDSGGCANGGGLGISPLLMETPFNLTTRSGDPVAWIVALHEAFHFQQYQYPGLEDPARKWVYEGQARMIQDQICIGANRATAQCFDDIATGFAGFVGQVNAYLGNPNRPINETSYDAALFWKYLAEKYGTSSPGDDVEAGMDLLVTFWEQVNANPDEDGIQGLNRALDELGHSDRFRDIWKAFAVANYAKDLSGPNVPPAYQYDDMAQPGGTYNAPFLSIDRALSLGEQIVDTDETVQQWAARYYEVRPASDVPVVDITITQDTAHTVYYTVLGIKNNDLVHEHNVEARHLEHTIENDDYDRVVVVVAGLQQMANYRVAINGSQPTLDIVSPTALSRARVGDPGAPDKFLLKVDLLDNAGVPLPGIDLGNFSFQIGAIDVPEDAILTSATVQGQHWFVIRAVPQTGSGRYDLTASYGADGALTDTENDAIDYTPRDEADSVIAFDRSGSMSQNDKLAAAQAAARLYVDSWHSGDMIGLVTFNASTSVPLGLTPWTDSPDGGSRQDAFDAIDALTASGNTAIGDALRASWDELLDHGDTNHDWAIVLLSDGLENAGSESFDDLIDALKNAGGHVPVVHAIAVGPDADRLRMQRVAQITGGAYQAVAIPTGSLQSALQFESLQLDMDARYRVIATDVLGLQQNFSLIGPLDDGNDIRDVVPIPVEGNAAEMVLSLSYESGWQTLYAPVLRNPSGDTVSPFKSTGRHVVWRVPTPQQGQWTLTIEYRVIGLQGDGDAAVTEPDMVEELLPPYLIHASLRSDVTMDVYLDADVDDMTSGAPVTIFASLTDTDPITNATVQAIVETPDGALIVRTLYDDGAHDDGAAGDGIYATRFTQTGMPGSYNVTVEAQGNSSLSGPFTRQALRSFYIHSTGDSDGDGLPDEWEIRFGFDPLVADDHANEDPDMDGLPTLGEWEQGTDPRNPDTDGGGEPDGSDNNPLDPSDDRDMPLLWASAQAHDGTVSVRYSGSTWAAAVGYRAPTPNGPFAPAYLTFSPTGIFTDTNVSNGTTYCYAVVASLNGGGFTPPSAPACATPNSDPLPPQGWVMINEGATRTFSADVTLNLWASDAVDPHLELPGDVLPPADSATGVQDMLVSNYPDFHDAAWEPYSQSKPWQLLQDSGLATVYVKYRDGAGNESEMVTATIWVDGPSLYLPVFLKR